MSAQIRQRILYISDDKRYVDKFVRELTFAERLQKHFLGDKILTIQSGRFAQSHLQVAPLDLIVATIHSRSALEQKS